AKIALDLASHTQDDGFHEIQLNGKQLVFLFMAATVVSVVIFLCGVLVGRGVRAERGPAADAAALTAAAETPSQQPGPAAPVPPREQASCTDVVPTSEPQGQGYTVQIAALNVRSEADAVAKRLASKGYAVYVLPPAAGTPQVFRVRIGKFGSRREAESMAAR